MRVLTRVAVVLAVLVGLAASGCSALNEYEQAQYELLVSEGNAPLEPYSPASAGILNVLPGFGDAYNEQWGAFVCNLLLWPLSVVWGIPEAVITAQNQNMKRTVYYYTLGPGKSVRKGSPAP